MLKEFKVIRHVIFVIVLCVLVASVHAERGSGEALHIAGSPESDNSRLAAMGSVNVSAAPFLADPTGEKDTTDALQRAIVFARDHQMVCLLPSDRYRVSDTLSCIQYRPIRRDGKRRGHSRLSLCAAWFTRRPEAPSHYFGPSFSRLHRSCETEICRSLLGPRHGYRGFR